MWNSVFDRRPRLIVRPRSVDDVVSAIRHARDEELVVSVRGGGHSVAGFSTCDSGMVIDLSKMREVKVDPVRRRATAQGGAHLSQLDKAVQAHGLVCPVGVVGHTGVAGLTLGGGMGRLQRKHGLTIDNVVSVDLVTADGEKVHASEEENAELFWGLRGAGANFGIATLFDFRLHPLDATVFQGVVSFPIDRTLEVAERVREFVATHDDVHLALYFSKENDEPLFSVGSMHCGPHEQAERDLRVFRELKPISDTFATRDYLELQGMADEAMGWGQRFYTKSGFLAELSDDVLSLCAEHADSIPAGAEINMWAQGGAIGRVPDDDMAYTGRSAPFNISAELVWTDPADDDERAAWGRAFIAKVQPHLTTGRYVNDVVEAGTPGAQIYGHAKYERLVALKRQYDPDNFFHLNQNIRAAARVV